MFTPRKQRVHWPQALKSRPILAICWKGGEQPHLHFAFIRFLIFTWNGRNEAYWHSHASCFQGKTFEAWWRPIQGFHSETYLRKLKLCLPDVCPALNAAFCLCPVTPPKGFFPSGMILEGHFGWWKNNLLALRKWYLFLIATGLV